MEYDGNKEQYTAQDMNHCPVMPYFVAVPMSGYVQTNSWNGRHDEYNDLNKSQWNKAFGKKLNNYARSFLY